MLCYTYLQARRGIIRKKERKQEKQKDTRVLLKEATATTMARSSGPENPCAFSATCDVRQEMGNASAGRGIVILEWFFAPTADHYVFLLFQRRGPLRNKGKSSRSRVLGRGEHHLQDMAIRRGDKKSQPMWMKLLVGCRRHGSSSFAHVLAM